MFNVRVKRFIDSEQIQVYSKVNRSQGEVLRKKVDGKTGEMLDNPRKDDSFVEFNPFTEQYERMREIPSQEYVEMLQCSSMNRTINAVYDVARSNLWEWFVTFTFAPDKVDRYNYSDCTKKMSQWLNNMKKICPGMVYLVVPELHKDGAYHFHGLFKNVDGFKFADSGQRDKQRRIIYNVHTYKFGFTTATQLTDCASASSYLCKYITKDLCAVTKGKKRYWASRNCKRPEVVDYLVEGMEHAEICMEYLKESDNPHIKTINGEHGTVTYIDRQIYSENRDLWNRLIPIPPTAYLSLSAKSPHPASPDNRLPLFHLH